MYDFNEVVESPLRQGADEVIVYQLSATRWGSNPTGVQVTAYDNTGGELTEVSESVIDGAPSVSGDVITLPALCNLTPGNVYLIKVRFTCGANTFACWLRVLATL